MSLSAPVRDEMLLPCPFCDEVPRRMNEGKLAHIFMHSANVRRKPICPCDGRNFSAAQWNTRTPASQVEAGEVERRYHELLFAVATKHEGENRHETALRYIREREAGVVGIAEQSQGKEQP